jgi:hypothetical protein
MNYVGQVRLAGLSRLRDGVVPIIRAGVTAPLDRDVGFH